MSIELTPTKTDNTRLISEEIGSAAYLDGLEKLQNQILTAILVERDKLTANPSLDARYYGALNVALLALNEINMLHDIMKK